MKLIHIADLHIGKTVNGFSMLGDQAFILERILGYVREYRPRAVLIAGDVYDKPVPGTDAVKVFDRFLTELVREGAAVLIISGNHDSPERLGFASGIMNERGVFLYGVFDGQMRTVALEDEYGEVRFYLLPYIRPSVVRRFFDDPGIETHDDAVRAVIASAGVDETKRNVLVAHQFVISRGEEPERSDSEVGPVGGMDAVEFSAMSCFDYAALGHLHGPQRVGGGRGRYAGSPLKYSFSEHLHKKSAVLLELGDKGHVETVLLPLTPLRDLRKLKGPMDKLIGGGAEASTEDYLHITLTDEAEPVDAIGKIRCVYPNVMALDFENSRTRASFDIGEACRVESSEPRKLFEDFFFAQNGVDMEPEQVAIVRELLELDGGKLV